MRRRPALIATLSILVCGPSFAAELLQADVCVYGATPSGILAAVTAKQEGKTVVLIEPSRWLGGILGAGIKPRQDCPEPKAVGGLTQSKVFIAGKSPPEIREFFTKWLEEEKVPVVYEHRVTRVEKEGARITQLDLERAPPDEHGIPVTKAKAGPGKSVTAKVFIDASYEGDVMAKAAVPYAVGRDARDLYDEEPAGVREPTLWRPVDPYVEQGKPESGLLPLVDADHGKPLGAGDDYTQAYNYRFYVTNDPAKRVEITPPENYDPKQFEVVGRYVEYIMQWAGGDMKKAQPRLASIFPGWKNAGEYNYQRNSLITIAPLGVSRYYQDGDWAARSRVWHQHRDHLRGLHHFLSTDSRVPASFRQETAALGMDRTMHEDTGGWPNQLYVRISRRMMGSYVLTHADVLNRTEADDSVGLALYGVDIYPVRRYAARDPKTGEMGVAVEGNMFIGGAKGTGQPYPIPYRSIIPKAEDCTNLIVPICFSSSYIAYASARMEPVFCVLGESAGVAAVQAINAGTSVQQIDKAALRARLLDRGQVLSWKPE
ncbi:MAG: FAD-dependent oxidoreductase [Verrucomicrobiota bacterium]